MNKKEKAAATKLSRTEIERELSRLSEFQKQLTKTQSKIDSITEVIDLRIAAIRQEYADEIGLLSRGVEEWLELCQQSEQRIAIWAEAHRDDQFDGKKKSIEFLTAVIGFRNLKPAVDTLKNWTQPKAALALLRKGWGKAYVEVKHSLKKNDLIKDREKLGSKLTTCGLVIEDTEEFYIEHKTETRDPAPEAK